MADDLRLAKLGRGALYSLPLLFLALFYFYPLGSILWASFAPGGRLDLGGVAEMLSRALPRSRLLVHALAGGRVHRADAAAGHAGRLRLCPLRLPRQAHAARADDHSLRHADGGHRRCVHQLAGAARCSQRLADGRLRAGAAAGRSPLHDLDHPAGARLLQRGGGGAHRRRVLERPRPAADGGRGGSGRVTAAAAARGHPSAAAAVHRGCIAAGLPLLLHQLRRHSNPGRSALCHAGGRDLPPDGQFLQPATGRRAVAAPAHLHVRGDGRLHPRPGARLHAAQPARRGAHGPPAGHRLGMADRRWGKHAAGNRTAGAAGGAGRPLGDAGRRSAQPALLRGPRREPHSGRVLRGAAGGDPQLAALCHGCGGAGAVPGADRSLHAGRAGPRARQRSKPRCALAGSRSFCCRWAHQPSRWRSAISSRWTSRR